MNSSAPEQEVKKRKNRWGSPQAADAANPNTTAAADGATPQREEEHGDKKPRKSRWALSGAGTDPPSGLPSANISALGNAMAAPSMDVEQQRRLQQSMVLKLELQRVNAQLQTVVQDALRIEQDPNRSPSPPPKYDSNGKRTNTREIRMRESLHKDRLRIIDEMLKLNPQYQAQLPPDFLRGKVTKIIYIPKQTDPLFNYIGLIIGPRGNTQKQMEQETGCKISIRGKGSAKEGSKGRSAGKCLDEDEELHAHVSGESQEAVDKACKMIEDLLKPADDESLNEHKNKQLRELALINGTLREDEFCPICGEQGHRQFECPHRTKSFKAAGVKCAICGDLSHPTRDCPFKKDDPNLNQSTLDNEYNSFLAELGGTAAPTSQAPATSQVSTSSSSALPNNTSLEPVASATLSAESSVPANAPVRSSGPTILAPIVSFMPTKKPAPMSAVPAGPLPPTTTDTTAAAIPIAPPAKPRTQTVIRVAQVMTGKEPPVLASVSSSHALNAAVTSTTGTTVVDAAAAAAAPTQPPLPPSVPY